MSNIFKLNKYFYKFIFIALFLVFTAPGFALATPADDAKAVLKEHIDHVMSLLMEPAFTDPTQRDNQIKKIDTVILEIFDFQEFSSRTIGKKWFSFSEQQKKDFIDAFASLLRSTYIEKMDKYDGESVNYTGSRTSKDGNKVEIKTTINAKGKEIPVSYQMLKKGDWIVYDVRIEGMSLVENYRSQFEEIFKSGGTPDDLIVRVKKLAEDLRSQNRTINK